MKTNEKDTKQGIVPALRFPEFHGSKGWNLRPLSDYLTEYRQKSDGMSKVHSVSLSKGIVNQIEYLGRSFSADDTSHYKLVKPYDVVYTKSPTGDFPYGIVKQNFNLYNVIVSPLYGVFTPNNRYIGYIIHSIFESAIRLNNYLSTLVQKGAKNTIQISNDTFISKEILLPDNDDEQQKIADCLSSINALIKATENKIDELKAHKKGLMQQLFPAEGKTVPALRFPEFQNAGEWTKGPLSRIGDVLQGYGFPEKYQGKSLGKYPFYKVSDISKAFQTGCNFISKAVNYIDDEELDILKIKTTPPGTTIFARIGEAIRLNRRIVTTQECIIDNNTVGVKAIPENAIDLFVYYILLQVDLIDFAGGVVPAVTKSAIENIPIYCPPTKSEQKKIVDCLSSVDNLIIAQTNRLEALRNHKKGLMQQLFPNIDEC